MSENLAHIRGLKIDRVKEKCSLKKVNVKHKNIQDEELYSTISKLLFPQSNESVITN